MGAVYRASAMTNSSSRIAIKVVKRGMDTDAVLERFRYERQILAFLNHPTSAASWTAAPPMTAAYS